MQKFKGRLLYTGWFNLPWRLVMNDGEEIDILPVINDSLISLNGKRVSYQKTLDSYTLFADVASEFQFKYTPEEYAILLEKKSNGLFINVKAYLDNVLVWLSGRLVEIEIEEDKQIKFFADASEQVFGVYFTDNNSCKVPNGAENTICKAGQPDCCIFLSASSGGFHCEKFNSSIARALLDRLANGNINASRIGNCAILGRKES